MNTRKSPLVAAAFALLLCVATVSRAQAMNDTPSLSEKQQSIIPIAAFAASGEMDRLNAAFADGLEAGLTVNEIKEILVQMYAYAGFPRSLNALNGFRSVLDARAAKGIEDKVGKDASPIPADLNKDEYGAKVRASLAGRDEIPPPAAWQKFSPIVDTFLKEHLFADIFARDILDFQSRELATVAALANMRGTEGQLRFHLGAAMNTGLTEAQMKDFVSVLKSDVGDREAATASKLLDEVLKSRSQ
jgi:alkylhydroperoxidase/carboxymuconolactone decarboxylase family protein YurZ